MQLTLIPPTNINDGLRAHCNVAEAARVLGVSESAIRRAAKKAGVRKISGRGVRGGILIDAHPYPVVILYNS